MAVGDTPTFGLLAREPHRAWHTPTGDPCPRSWCLDGGIEGTGDCHGCGFCLLLAGLVDTTAPHNETPDAGDPDGSGDDEHEAMRNATAAVRWSRRGIRPVVQIVG